MGEGEREWLERAGCNLVTKPCSHDCTVTVISQRERKTGGDTALPGKLSRT